MRSVLLIDDEPLARAILKEYLEAFPGFRVVEECKDGFEGLKAIARLRPDLIFLDIQMPKINGFEMLELIEDPPPVIFVTAFDEYAIRAFEQHAVDYLLKPFSEERFAGAIARFLERPTLARPGTETLLAGAALSPQQKQRVVVKSAGTIKIIPVEEMQYLEAADDYVRIHTAEGNFLKNRTMSYFEELLDAHQYVRTHRSYIVNIQQITRIEPYEKENYLVILKNGKQIPVSRSGYAKLKQVLGI